MRFRTQSFPVLFPPLMCHVISKHLRREGFPARGSIVPLCKWTEAFCAPGKGVEPSLGPCWAGLMCRKGATWNSLLLAGAITGVSGSSVLT